MRLTHRTHEMLRQDHSMVCAAIGSPAMRGAPSRDSTGGREEDDLRTIFRNNYPISVQESSEAQGSLFAGARRHATLNAHSSHSAPVAYHIPLRPRIPCSTSSEAMGRGWEDIQCGHMQVTESSEPAGRYRQTTLPRDGSVQPAESSAAADVLFIKRGREECRASAEGGTRQGRTRSWVVEAPTYSRGPA